MKNNERGERKMQKKRCSCLLRSKDGWASLVGMLIAVAIAFFLYAAYTNFNQKGRPEMREAQEALESVSGTTSSGSSATGSLGTLQSATRQIQAIDERNRQRGDDLMKEIGAMQGN